MFCISFEDSYIMEDAYVLQKFKLGDIFCNIMATIIDEEQI